MSQPSPARAHGHMVYEHICSLAAPQFEAMHKRRHEIKSVEDLATYIEQVRDKFNHLLKRPDTPDTPLNAHTTSKIERDGYIVETVVFESRPSFFVTANLYIPTDVPHPVPGILHPLGHSWLGKAAESYQRASITMVKHGFAVLSYDPIGQGERVQYWDPLRQMSAIVPTERITAVAEHEYSGMQSLLVDISMGGLMVWDAMRALDYLMARPEVDSEKVGCTGVSGGGVLTTYLTALDERVKVAAPLCYVTARERWLHRNEYADAEQVQDDVIKEGIDHGELCLTALPRPLLIGTATKDFFPVEGAKEAYELARWGYGLHGLEDRVGIIIADSVHGFQPEHRVAVADWFRRWLYGDENPQVHDFGAEAKLEEIETLSATPGGQVHHLGGRSVFHFTKEEARKLAAQRAGGPIQTAASQENFAEAVSEAQKALATQLKGLLRLDELAPITGEVPYELTEEASFDESHSVSELIFESEPGISIHAGIVYPSHMRLADESLQNIVLVTNKAWREELVQPFGKAIGLLSPDVRLLIVEMRGLGTVPSEPPRMSNSYRRMGVEGYHFYNYGMVGRSLLGNRVLDVWQGIRCLQELSRSTQSVTLYGEELAGLVALLATALDPTIAGANVERVLLSYESLATSEFYHQPPGVLIPGILKVCDLPDVAACVAPRQLTLRNPADPMGRVALAKEAETTYESVRRVYDQLGAGDHFRLEI